MKTNCDNPLLTDRHWSDAWWILFEMAICAVVGIGMLIIDIYDRKPSADAQEDFKARMYMAYDEIPLYLRSTRRRCNHGRKSI